MLCLFDQGVGWAQNASPQGDVTPQLSHATTVVRQGRTLVLTYKLLDATGQARDVREVSPVAPSFTVYQGDKKLASGQFEFG